METLGRLRESTIASEELQRDSYVNAELHIRHTEQALLLKLQGMNIEQMIESDHLTYIQSAFFFIREKSKSPC